MNEPRTIVEINDFTVGYGVDPVDNRLNILCPIISPAGPTELTRVTGPSMLKRLYFGGRSITTSDDYSAIFARAVSANAPIYIKRGTRDKLFGGKSSAIGGEIYTDSSLNPIEGLKVKFSQGSSDAYATALAALTGIVTDYNVYSADIQSSEIIVANTLVSDIPIKKSLKLTATNTTSNMVLKIGNNFYTIAKNTANLDALAKKLAEDGYCPNVILKDVSGTMTAQKAEYRNGTWTASTTGITELQWLSDIAIVPSGSYGSYISITRPENVTIKMAKIKSEEEFNKTKSISKAIINVTIEGTSYSFYTDNATVTGTPIRLGDNLDFYELMSAFVREISDRFGGDSSVGNVVIIPGATTITVSSTGNLLSVSSESVNSCQYNDRFAVLAAFPCEGDYIHVSIKKSEDYKVTDEEGNVISDPEVYTINAEYSNDDISESWDIAFDSGLVDGYGDSLYFQRVNEESQIIRIAELSGDNVQAQSFYIGSDISSEYCGVSEIISAYESIVEKEEAPVMFDYITDGGLVDASLSSYIIQMCKKYHSFYPASVPTDVTLTESKLESRRNQIGDFFAANCIGATQRGAYLDSGSAIFPASYYYLAERIALGNTSSEFKAIFGQSNGDIGMQNPIQKFTEAVRERLLDKQIPTLKKEATGVYCINTNLTCKKQKSYMQEDGVALMINKINQIADTYGKSIISLPNTDRTRASIESSLTQSITGRLRVGTDNGPQSIRVQCDRSNNPQSLINQWKVRIDIYATFANSIREVLIYTNVLPLQ